MNESIVYTQMHSFLDSIATSMRCNDLQLKMPVDNIVIYGMGGSAISANIINDCSVEFLKVPIDILRYPLLPGYVGSNTLIIISSYSGNTFETLLFYEMVKTTRAQVVVICSGGELAKRATEDHILVMMMPGRLQPRFSIGHSIGFLSRVLSSIGYPQLEQQITESIQSLLDYRDYLDSNDSPANCIVQELLDNHVIVIYPKGYESVAQRWKGQFNENAKTIAFDMCEDEFKMIKSRANIPHLEGMAALIIEPNITAQYPEKAITRYLVQDLAFNAQIIKINGQSKIEVLLKMLMLGDYLSIILAEKKHVDPLDVSIITELKTNVERENSNK